MKLMIISGSGNLPLADEIARSLDVPLGTTRLVRSPDGELRAAINEHLRARDVFLIQPISPPPDRNLMELLFLADACRASGANSITAVIPYLGYSRRSSGEPGPQALGIRLIAELLRTAGVNHVIAVDLHEPSTQSAFAITIEHLSTTHLLCEALGPQAPDAVVVAADMAALPIAERYGRELNLPIAIVAKVRINDQEVVARNLIGDVRGKRPLIVDDKIITGATIEAALNASIARGATKDAIVTAAHGLFVGNAMTRLAALPISRLLVTDSVLISPEAAAATRLRLEVEHLAPLLSQAIARLYGGEPLNAAQ